MGKVKIKKSDVWIDMTPMSDVMTLLLTFFMLTSTFVKNEPVKVNTPGSVSEIKVPENGVLTILVSPEKDKAGKPTGEGQVFMSIDNTDQLGATLSNMTGLKATSTSSSVTFSWDENVSATGYLIQQYKDGEWKHIRQLVRNLLKK